jgi:hypothetical protein
MILNKIAICATALVFATITAHLAQPGGKGGVSASSPGHIMQNTTPAPPKGASTLSPGSQIKDDTTPRKGGASELAPSDSINKSKK